MILCLDIGNSHLFGGVFADNAIEEVGLTQQGTSQEAVTFGIAQRPTIKASFRYASDKIATSDQLGIFFKSALRENKIDPKDIKRIALCSVVPSLDYSAMSACSKYFNIDPFVLKPGDANGLSWQVNNPLEVGADRIATSIAATHYFPEKNIIVADFGTATTYCAISKKGIYLGGVILPGIKTAMQSLVTTTAKLPPVEIIKTENVLGKTTAHNIQAGLYYGQLGAAKSIIQRLSDEAFLDEKAEVIGTGGFAHLFADELPFTAVVSDLVLQGLRIALLKFS